MVTVSPDSAAGWVGDSVLLMASTGGPDAHRLSLDSLSWTTGSAVVSATDAGPGRLQLVIFGGGVTTITVRLGLLSDTATLVAMEEGEILASFPFPVEWYSAPAVGADGSVYALRSEVEPAALVALDPDLKLKWDIPCPTGVS